MKKYTRDDTEHGETYYLASDVDGFLAAPPKRQPLTPGAIRNLYARHCDPVEFARAVEAAYEASAKR